jgi:hypothetical protein
VAVIAAVHLLLCAPHASDMGADSTAVWAAIAGFAHHHATATDISQTPHGTSLDVAGGDGPNVEHDCVTVAVKHRPGGDGVPASTGPPLPLSCASPGAAGPAAVGGSREQSDPLPDPALLTGPAAAGNRAAG